MAKIDVGYCGGDCSSSSLYKGSSLCFSVYPFVLITLPHVIVIVFIRPSYPCVFSFWSILLLLLSFVLPYSPLLLSVSIFFSFSLLSLLFSLFFFLFFFVSLFWMFFFRSISFVLSLFFFSFSPLYLNQFFLQSLILPTRFCSYFSPSVQPLSPFLSIYFCLLFSSSSLSIYKQRERDSPYPI